MLSNLNKRRQQQIEPVDDASKRYTELIEVVFLLYKLQTHQAVSLQLLRCEFKRRNGRYFKLFHQIRQLWSAVKVRPTLSATSIYPKESTFRQCYDDL